MSAAIRVLRDVTPAECWWLDAVIPAGTTVFRFDKPTYGCVTPAGIAVSLVEGEYPFFELPLDAVADVKAGRV